jgi:tetratricopeptide (TPR) repeat protein
VTTETESKRESAASIKLYKYEKGVRRTALMMLAAFAYVFAVAYLLFPNTSALLRIMLIVAAIFVAELLLLWYLERREQRIEVMLDDKNIVLKDDKGEQRVDLTDISHLEFSFFFKLLVRLEVVSADSRIRIGGTLADYPGFLRRFKKTLDGRGLSHCYEKLKFLRAIMLSDYLAQSIDKFRRLLLTLALITILGGLVGFALGSIGRYASPQIFWWVVLSSGWSLAAYGAVDFLLTLSVIKRAERNPSQYRQRNRGYERAFTMKGISAASVVYLVAAFGLLVPRLTDHRAFWEMYIEEGKALHAEKRYEEAGIAFARATKRAEKISLDAQELAESLIWNADICRHHKKYPEAEGFLKDAIIVAERKPHPEQRYLMDALDDLANIHLKQEHYNEAERPCKRLLEIKEEIFGAEHPDVAKTLSDLAWVYENQERYPEATELYKRIIEIYEESGGMESLEVASSSFDLALLYMTQKEYKEAEPLFKRIVSIMEGEAEPDYSLLAETLEAYAEVLIELDRDSEAEDLQNEAKLIREEYAEEIAEDEEDRAWD